MSDATEEAMAPLNVAKRHLRAALKVKLKAVSHDSIISQSTAAETPR
jgi:5-formyltetrahydrofolate cyclo-ligase